MLSSRNRKSWLLAFGMLLLSCVDAPTRTGEICGNGKDDDADGQVDCADSDCAGLESCSIPLKPAANLGNCKMCGKPCANQSECLDLGYHKDEPLPMCLAGVCDGLREGLRIRFEVDTSSWSGMGIAIRSINTRLIQKTALDGSEVTCVRLKQEASSKLEVDAKQLDRSGKFNFLSFDVSAVKASPGDVIIQPLMISGTGSNFVIWTELWAGAVDSNSKMPTGNRLGFACVESGPAVAAISVEHDWANPKYEATRRTIRVTMPAPGSP